MSSRVSVVMSIFNGEKYLDEAIESILHQTFSDFEFIIIDDGSSDSTPGLLARQAERDSRILIRRFDNNRGLSTALNFGIRLARGEYIARMDADDISLPNRLQEQVAFMDAHPEVGVCGTWVELIGDKTGKAWKYPTQHEAIWVRMLFANALVHPSVMIRLATLQCHNLFYDTNTRYAQDYELWSRALFVTRLSNIDRLLVQYRIHEQSIGAVYPEEQFHAHEGVYRRLLSPLGIEFTTDELRLHQQIGTGSEGSTLEFFQCARKWLEKLFRANNNVRMLPLDIFSKELGKHWTQICKQSRIQPTLLLIHNLASPIPFEGRSGIRKWWRAFRFAVNKARYYSRQ